MPRCFIDSNIVIYAIHTADLAKRQIAQGLLHHLLNSGDAVVSTQVLVEVASVLLQKIGVPPAAVRQELRYLSAGQLIVLDVDVVCQAILARDEYQVSFWDACIIAAAQQAGCEILYTEDLNPGQKYGTVLAVDPFAEGPQQAPPL